MEREPEAEMAKIVLGGVSELERRVAGGNGATGGGSGNSFTAGKIGTGDAGG